MKSFENHLRRSLEAIREEGQWRELRPAPEVGGAYRQEGRRWLNFSSNDYLDLARHERVREQASAAVAAYGGSATASRLMAGDLSLHHALEARLASLTGHERALVFPSGYQTNIAVLSALTIPGDVIFSDALNHASIIDGTRLARTHVEVYRHRDCGHLEALLKHHAHAPKRIIVTDSVFSMDGDLAPLEALAELAEIYDAMLVVDEAHAIGIWGKGGGLARSLGVQPDVTVGTLGKSLGSAGGFAASSTLIRDCIINRGRTFIFTTGLNPAAVGAAMGALDVIEADPGLGERLLELAALLHHELAGQGVDAGGNGTHILPVFLGDGERVVAAAKALRDDGLVVTAIRPPSVPPGTSRLRLSVTLAHTQDDFQLAAAAVARQIHVLSGA